MHPGERLRVFFDADALIAGAASSKGASYLLLRLSELGLIQGVTCSQAITEAERNIEQKLPAALPVFRAIIVTAQVTLVRDAPVALIQQLGDSADESDLPILAAATHAKSDYLVTFNLRHYRARAGSPRVIRPGDLVARIRRSLVALT